VYLVLYYNSYSVDSFTIPSRQSTSEWNLVVLAHADGLRRGLVQILHGEAKGFIIQSPLGLIVAITIREEHATVEHLGVQVQITRLRTLFPLRVPLRGRAMLYGPLRIRGLGDALDTLKHLALSESETRNINRAVPELGQRRGLVIFILGEFLQTEQFGNCPATLRPGSGVDGHIAVIKDGECAFVEVKAISVRSAAQAELVPEIAYKQEIGAHAKTLDLCNSCVTLGAEVAVIAERVVGAVVAVPVGFDVRNTGLCSGADESENSVGGRPAAHAHHEDLLAAEGVHKAGVILVVNPSDFDVVGHFIGAAGAGDGRNDMLAVQDELFGEM
jgi:hypothetical protein